jgi:predicted RNA binding protein YcfA (HicA-like mRNA interferase family)
MKAREIINSLEKRGWYEVKGRGSHRNFKHPTLPGRVTVPFHGARDIPKATAHSIMKQAGIQSWNTP